MNRTFLAVCRTIHIYLTMAGLAVMLFFGVTGFTVNHEDWLGATEPRVEEREGKTPVELLAKTDHLRVVEHLRSTFQITGAMSHLDDEDQSLAVAFKAPGQTWEVQIDKASGDTKVHQELFNFTAVINNLHRGRYSGRAWSWIIDISAVLIVLACATGVILWLALPKRRKLGIAFLIVGTVITYGVYQLWVPGADVKVERIESPK
jgi:hypothetical protein